MKGIFLPHCFIFAAGVFAAGIALTAFAQAPQLDKMDIVMKSVPDGPVARVNGVPIARAEFARLYTMELLRADQLSGDKGVPDGLRVQLGLRTLGNLIQQELLYQDAVKRGIQVTPAEVEERWKKQMTQYQKDGKQLSEPEVLQTLGVKDRQHVLGEVKRMLLVEKSYEYIIEQSPLKADEAAMRERYDAQKAFMVQPETLHLRQIFIRGGETEQQRRDARARADEALKRIHAGQRFDAVVKEVSEAPGKEHGGEMGPAPAKDFPEFMLEAAMRLKPEQISPVIASEFGYHIIQLISLAPGREISFDEAKPALERLLLAEKSEELINNYSDTLLNDPQNEVLVYLELEKNLALDPTLHQLLVN